MLGALAILAAGSGAWAADKLPPIGKRQYVIDRAAPFAPVVIKKDQGKPANVVLKDPLQPGHEAKVLAPVRKPIRRRRPARRREMPGQLRFHALTVSGHLLQPRAKFAPDYLSVGRADEPTSRDFLDKVYAPAHDDSF